MKNVYDPSQAQTLTDHLTELRDRLIRSAWSIAFMSAIGFFFAQEIIEQIVTPAREFLPGGKLTTLNPADAFISHMKVAVLAGVIASCPVWIYQAWMFVAPGLYSSERKFTAMFIGSGTGLFLAGVSFSYFLALPMALQFLLTFGADSVTPMITLPEYLSFFTTMTLVFGAAFELPLVIVILGVLGLVDQKFLRDKRRYAVVAMAALAAIITPPDVLSMMLLLGPMWALYEGSILLVGIFGKRKPVESID